MRCHRCSFEVEVKEKIGRQKTCPKCGVYLHCCLNCRFYDTSAYHQCCETEAEWVNDKESGNFCEYFDPDESTSPGKSSKVDDARNKLDQLFKT